MDWEGNKQMKADYEEMIALKNQKTNLRSELQKLSILMNLRFVQGLLFIKCALRKIEISKKLFILDLE